MRVTPSNGNCNGNAAKVCCVQVAIKLKASKQLSFAKEDSQKSVWVSTQGQPFPFQECPVCVRTGRDLVLAWSAFIAVPGYGGVGRSANKPRREPVTQEPRLCGNTKSFFLTPLSPSLISSAATLTRPSSGCLFFGPKCRN